MSSIQAFIPSSPPGNGPVIPMYFSKGFASDRTGRITAPPCSTTNSTRSPGSRPRRSRMCWGTVIWPLLFILLEFLIFARVWQSGWQSLPRKAPYRRPALRSRPVRKCHRHWTFPEMAVQRCVEFLDWRSVGFGEMASPVWAAAVGIGEAVFVGEIPGAEYFPRLLLPVRVSCKGGDGSSHEQRRFRMQEVGILFSGVAPVLFLDAEVIQHGLGAQESGSDGESGDLRFAQFVGHSHGQPNHRNLHQVVEQVAAVAKEVAVSDFDDQSASALEVAAFHHERRRIATGDDVRMHGLMQHGQSLIERKLPESLAEFGERIAAPYVINQNVELALLLTLNAGDKFLNVTFLGVIAANGDAFAAEGRDYFRRFVDGLAAALGGGFPAHAASGAIDGSASFAESAGDTSSSATRGAGDQSDTALERFHGTRCYTQMDETAQPGSANLLLSRIVLRISRNFTSRIEPGIIDRRARRHFQRNDSSPGGERIVFFIVDGRADSDLG